MLIPMIKAPFGIVWTLVGAATPFSTWSLTRPHAWTHGASGFPCSRGAGKRGRPRWFETTPGARPAAGPGSSPQARISRPTRSPVAPPRTNSHGELDASRSCRSCKHLGDDRPPALVLPILVRSGHQAVVTRIGVER